MDPDPDSHGKVKGKMPMPTSACPSTAHKNAFVGSLNPHVPSWNQSESGTVPDFIKQRGDMDVNGCCDPWEVRRQHIGFRNRSSSLLDLDDMIGAIFDDLEEMDVLDNTYVMYVCVSFLGEKQLEMVKLLFDFSASSPVAPSFSALPFLSCSFYVGLLSLLLAFSLISTLNLFFLYSDTSLLLWCNISLTWILLPMLIYPSFTGVR